MQPRLKIGALGTPSFLLALKHGKFLSQVLVMNRRKGDEEHRWARFMHSEEYADSLFEALRRVYIDLTPKTQMVDAIVPGDNYNSLNHFLHVETSTSCGSLIGRNRSLSLESDIAEMYRKIPLIDYRQFVVAGIVGGLTSSFLGGHFGETSRLHNTLSGTSTGFMVASVLSLLSTTPILGDVASLALHATLNRSKMYQMNRTSKEFSQSVLGCACAIAGARMGELICHRYETNSFISYSSSILSSIFCSYLVRRLVAS